jgi:HSP20 family protein
MQTNQNVEVRESTNVDGRGKESARLQNRAHDQERVMVPAVDIFEDAHRITIRADMPGVAKDGLSVQADRNGLVIEGKLAIQAAPDMQAIYADLHASKYWRSFVLSRELDSERIDASLKDGVLTVRIPKRTEFQTRKIKVNVG